MNEDRPLPGTRSADTADTPEDQELLAELGAMWREWDPEPPDLADRVVFGLSLDHLEYELLRIQQQAGDLVGARGEERVRTVTFTSESLTVLVSATPAGGTTRVDGWISGGDGVQVELRGEDVVRRDRADPTGRFVFEDVGRGLVQLVFLPTDGAGLRLVHPVVTPSMRI